jgi:hypothetical protein
MRTFRLACVSHTRACRNHTRECHNQTNTFQNHTLREEITLGPVEITVVVQKRYAQLLWLLFTQRRNIVHQSG